MKTQEQIRAEIDRLIEEDRLAEADALIDQLVPIGAEEFRRRLDAAPIDDEPLTQREKAALERFWQMMHREGHSGRQHA